MSLLAYGVSHKSAPIAIREQITLNGKQLPVAIQDLVNQTGIKEAVILSTCNRTEIYTTYLEKPNLEHWLKEYLGVSKLDLTPYHYHYQNEAAIHHLLRVASGLDSMIVGETQIFGQLKQAYQAACDMGSIGPNFKHLFPSVFAHVKKIRTQTALGSHSLSWASLIVSLIKKFFKDLPAASILLIGAGETIELIATHLYGQNVRDIIMANRTVEKAKLLAAPFQAHPIRMKDIPFYLPQVDVVITATASQLPILGKGIIESTLKKRQNKPLFIADLAVPRDVEVEVGELENIYLYDLDTIQKIIHQNKQQRALQTKQAEAMAKTYSEQYLHQLRLLNAHDMIRLFRNHIERIKNQELEKALLHLQRGEEAKAVLDTFAQQLMMKIMHQPTINLRKAAHNNQHDLLIALKELYRMD